MQNIIFPSAAWCFEDEKKAKESAALIRGLDAKIIYYGHGRRTVTRKK